MKVLEIEIRLVVLWTMLCSLLISLITNFCSVLYVYCQVGLGNNSINRQYREPMMRNNQYRRFFEEAIISHLQYIAVYCNILQ